jgi:hypothetical protein
MMKIALVGGGFYGCYIADTLKKKYHSQVNIDIFDRSDSLMTRAATNNQCRLHLGFHYPRSAETIRQTISGFDQFVDDFGDCVEYPKQNYYAVHRNGYINFDEYLAVMDEHNLKYDIVSNATHRFFRQPKDIEGVIRVGEGVIRLGDLLNNLLARLKENVQIHCNAIVSSIDAENGSLVVNDKVHEGYDVIINATYTDTNLGLPKEKHFELKYEVTAMLVVDAPFGDDVALTIMDGPFVSLYPAGQGKATLSSVIFTPFLNCLTTSDLETQLEKVKNNKIRKSVIDDILNHGNELLDMDLSHHHVQSLWIAPKTKVLNDNCDQRLTEIRTHEKLISVLCGKLDAVHHITNQIVEVIEGCTEQNFAKVVDF